MLFCIVCVFHVSCLCVWCVAVTGVVARVCCLLSLCRVCVFVVMQGRSVCGVTLWVVCVVCVAGRVCVGACSGGHMLGRTKGVAIIAVYRCSVVSVRGGV